jgi:hypothetical protein
MTKGATFCAAALLLSGALACGIKAPPSPPPERVPLPPARPSTETKTATVSTRGAARGADSAAWSYLAPRGECQDVAECDTKANSS